MNFYLKTFGCQMNISDSERLAGILKENGHNETNEKEAQILIINVCSVRQRAMDRVYALAHQWWKNKKGRVILTGCVLEKDQKKLKKKVELFLPINQIDRLPMIFDSENTSECETQKSYLKIKPRHNSKISAYVPIMTGCNNFCAYCVVPYTRGREISRPADEVIEEVRGLIKAGYKEIILLGQNVNSYSSKTIGPRPTSPELENSKLLRFSDLLKKINGIPGNFWIRFLTSHPKDMSDELINTIAKCEKVGEYIHLPIQAGDDKVLKAMNRKYTTKHYLNLMKKIRAKIPDAAISTDIIVGFPGETRKQFENTVKIFKKVGFDFAFIAQYSPRPGTAAEKMKDNVSAREKKRRYTILNKLLKEIAKENNQKLIGKELDVLVEKCDQEYCFGKTRTMKNVKFQCFNGKNIVGKFIKMKVIKAGAWGLEGSSTLS